MTLQDAGVSLIDCDHRTPPHAESGYAYIAIPQLKDGHIRLDGVRLISEVDYFEWTKKLKPQEDDVIVVRRCNSGDSAVVPRNFKGAIGQNLVVLRASGELVDKKFLRWLIRSPDWWEQVNKFINVGAVFDSLKCREIPHFELPIPPMYTQKEMALILGSIDNRIQLLRETNTTLESIAQALFKSWFVDFDPVHANAGTQAPSLPPEIQSLFPSTFVESPLGLVPEGWGVGTIGDLANVKGGFAFKGDSFCDSGVPVIKIKNIVGDGTVDIEGVQYVDIEQAEKSKKFQLNDGDILMAMTGATIGKTGIVVTGSQAPLLNQRVAKFEPKYQELNNGWLIYTAFQNGFMADQILNAASGSAQANISTSGIESAKLILPENPSILKVFEETVSTTFAGWIENHKQTKTLSILRDTLLPRLISGQLRLPEVEELIEESA